MISLNMNLYLYFKNKKPYLPKENMVFLLKCQSILLPLLKITTNTYGTKRIY